jgi:hypothetical protein
MGYVSRGQDQADMLSKSSKEIDGYLRSNGEVALGSSPTHI